MAFLGRLGAPGSRLGNIILGYGGHQTFPPTLNGVTLASIGEMYDLALGYDPGVGAATMYGYVIAEGQEWTETTQLQDLQRLISVSSPSTTDRDLTRWPMVSQGNWPRGERQVIFEDPDRYYMTDGAIDVSKANQLSVLPSDGLSAATYTLNGTYNLCPLESDGAQWYAGIKSGANNLLIGTGVGTTRTAYSKMGGTEIFDMIHTPRGIIAGNAAGIYLIKPDGTDAVQYCNDAIGPIPARSLAYLSGSVLANDAIYYITSSDTKIMKVSTEGGAAGGTAVLDASGGVFEKHFSFICSTAGELMFGAWTEYSATSYTQRTALYTFDGTTRTKLDEIDGAVRACTEVNGVVYLLCKLFQSTTKSDYTLYSYTNGTLQIIDDLRSAPSDFQANDPSSSAYAKPYLWSDGRFLYIAWPGLVTQRLDLVTGGVSRVGPGTGGAGLATLTAHRAVTTNAGGLLDITAAGGVATVRQFNAANTTGQIITSYYDFGTPGLVKYFRSVDIELVSVLPSGSSIAADFQLDAADTWTPATINLTLANRFTAYLPRGTKGTRVRFRFTLTGNPTIRQWSVKANLARVWKTVVSCLRNQMLRNKQEDDQGKAQDLIKNLQDAYANASNVILFVPSPTGGGAEQVNATLESYTWTAKIPGYKIGDGMAGGKDQEGDVEIELSETL